MTTQAAEELLRHFCDDLHTMWRQAGGPSLRILGGRVGLSKSQVGAILSGQIRRPPDWDVVRVLVSAVREYAEDHDCVRHVSLRAGLEEFWRPRYTIIEQAYRTLRTTRAGAPAVDPTIRGPVPRQLPPAVRWFTGRESELGELTKVLDLPAEGSGTVVISSISGMAGVGKTALAVHWAHGVADRFPDGQMYVDLRGYHPERPMSAAEASAGFLGALGVPDWEMPQDPGARSARYRTELARRRMVIVLDNASSVEQVRPLLPGTDGCLVLVTSRDSLAGLVALDGAHRLSLAALPLPEASELLRRLIGSRAEIDAGAVTTLAQRCARLPLALRLAAELAGRRVETPLAELVAELDGGRRLELLAAGGDSRGEVAAVFSWSLQHLPSDAARVFRLLGLHPGSDIDAHAVAALADTDLPAARRALDQLAQAHLVHPATTGRYGMHDLLRAYATSLVTGQDSDTDHRAALDRLFDYYLTTTAGAIDRLFPAESRPGPRLRAATTPTPDFADAHAARRWLDTELPTLVAVAAYTLRRGWPGHTVGLSIALHRYLDRGHNFDALVIHGDAYEAARQTGDPIAQAHALAGLGCAEYRLSRNEIAADHLQRSLALFRESSDAFGEARTRNILGYLHFDLGGYDSASDHFRQGLALFRQIANRSGEATLLCSLGFLDERQGRYDRAIDYHTRALVLARQSGDWVTEARALDGLGAAMQRLGLYGSAADHHEQALVVARRLGHVRGEAHIHDSLGTTHLRLGHLEQARDCFERALAVFVELGDRGGRASALNGLGEAADAAGHTATALNHFTAALAAGIGAGGEAARAHAGLGRAYHANGDYAEAQHHYERALGQVDDLQPHDVDDLRARLATLPEPCHQALRPRTDQGEVDLV